MSNQRFFNFVKLNTRVFNLELSKNVFLCDG